MSIRVQALGVIALLVAGCGSDAYIRLLEPDSGADAATTPPPHDAGTPPHDAGTQPPPHDAGTSPHDASVVDDAGTVADALDALMLRYDFSGTAGDTVVIDRAGTYSAQLLGGAALDGDGGVALDGDDDYVDMPNHLISKLTNATFVSWLNWDGGVCWQRVFDFGANSAGEDKIGRATSSLFVATQACGSEALIAEAEFGSKQIGITGPASLPSGHLVQVALVVDGQHDTFALYVDGARQAQASAGFKLSDIDDVNNWLGQSQWVQDVNLSGRYDEFRIYAAALSDSQIKRLYERGPNRL
jgi:hypothetical protein